VGLIYATGFEVGGENTMTGTFAGTGISIASGLYMPGQLDTNNIAGWTWVGDHFTSFSEQVRSKLAVIDATFDVVWSQSTGKYTIVRSTNFTMTFSTAADLRLMAALGFTGNKSGAATYTSDYVPTYEMASAISGRTSYRPPTEPDDIAEMAVSDGGDDFVVTRKVDELLTSWVQQMEPYTSCVPRARSAASLSTWTWREFFRHARGTYPIWCSESLPGEADGAFYRLTDKGAAYKGVLYTSDFLDYTGVPFECHWLGAWNP
jgi:hypothetical protein